MNLKFLLPHLIKFKKDEQRIIREAKAVAALNHSNICTIYNVDKHKDNQFIIMEYIKGETLQEKIKEGDLTLEKALDKCVPQLR